MKKLVSTLMIASVFAVGFSAFNPVNTFAQDPPSHMDDGEWCPCSGSGCVWLTIPPKGDQR